MTMMMLDEGCSPLCTSLLPPTASSLIGSKILINTLFSNTLSLCPSLNVGDRYCYMARIKIHKMNLCSRIFSGQGQGVRANQWELCKVSEVQYTSLILVRLFPFPKSSTAISREAFSSTTKNNAAGLYQTTRSHTPADSNLNCHKRV
jgi:hypothetical protein